MSRQTPPDDPPRAPLKPLGESANIHLAPFAVRAEASRGRLFEEPESTTRTPFQRDRDRIVHAGAFRRLQYKTQVFIYHEGDYYRTRLTHSLEVAQIARSICRVLGLNEDLAEALALAHDLGHTPFGHAGEEALNEVMRPFGGFDHNEQAFRILTQLEQPYAAFDGLNLTWETLEGLVKHNGPLTGPNAARKGPPPASVSAFCARFDLELSSFAGAEAQVAALADDIAYNNHDIDDGLRAGLFMVEDLAELPLVGPMFAEVRGLFPDAGQTRLMREVVRRLIDTMVNDLIAETQARLDALRPNNAPGIRAAERPVVAFSDEMRQNDRALRAFLFRRMYRHYKVNRMTSKARRVVRELFAHYVAEPNTLPPEWEEAVAAAASEEQAARTVADYIAGMTDRYAIREHRKLFDIEEKT
ncbi:MAG: deoxyguanosinetriphosphate triphosphohydrolase [Rhodovibrionaceae bacterium]|nr:deoxyguanosinetriphosphate triphosphohydrolase [Rhodovibrionaceae bacterium]